MMKDQPTYGVLRGGATGLVAGGIAVAAMLGFGLLTGQITLAEVLAQTIAGVTPIDLIERMVITYGEAAKHALFASGIVGILIAGTVIGIVAGARRWPRATLVPVVLACAVVAAGLLLVAIFMGVLGSPNVSVAISMLVSLGITTGVYVMVLVAALPRPAQSDAQDDPDNARRAFLKNTALGIGALICGGGMLRWLADVVATPPRLAAQGIGTVPMDQATSDALVQALTDGVPGVSSEVTPNDRFYVVSKNVFRDPDVNAGSWRLQIKGQVDHPMTLTYQDVKNLPPVTQYLTLQCISNVIGGDLMGNALWRGASLADLLQQAGVRPGAVDVILRCADDYTDSIPIEKAMQPDTILAYEMNGEALPKIHGYPVRLLVPDIYGMKNVKWITEIEVVEYDYKGYWENRGWSDVAVMNITSRIDTPRNGRDVPAGASSFIGGVAVAGQRGIQQVEVSTDGGQTWAQAAIKPGLGQDTWVLWLYQWDVPLDDRGDHRVLVRATDGTGALQDATPRDTLPSGATGYHAISVRTT
ncbi:MAG TPA: sulfite oxidase [Chloroflexota bacterium]|nr:sulfite oxidase [Chloroflexota bacterium]